MNEGMASLIALIIIGWLVAPLFDELDKSKREPGRISCFLESVWARVTYPIDCIADRMGAWVHPVLVMVLMIPGLAVFFLGIVLGCLWLFDAPVAI